MKKSYEIYMILTSHLEKSRYTTISEQVQSWITQETGEIHYFNVEGLKPLATPIKKQNEGYYILCQFSVPGESLLEIKRKLGLNEDILRYMIVTLDSVNPRFKTKQTAAAT